MPAQLVAIPVIHEQTRADGIGAAVELLDAQKRAEEQNLFQQMLFGVGATAAVTPVVTMLSEPEKGWMEAGAALEAYDKQMEATALLQNALGCCAAAPRR